MKLRDYQKELINGLRESVAKGNRRILGILPTGGGKTVTFSYMVKGAFERGRRILILTDRTELLTQAGGALNSVGLNPVKIEAGKTPYLGANLYTGMVETISRRVSKRKDYQHWLKSMDMIVIDEAHKRSFTKLFQYFGTNARVYGFTATPDRIGRLDPLSDTYTDIVVGVEIKYLVDNGYLARPNYYGVKADLSGIRTKAGDYDQTEVANRFSQSKLYKGVVENWEKHTPDTKTLVFSSSISNSLELVDEFLSKGYKAKHLDATMSKSERERVLDWFHRSPNGILCNVGILTTGFDEPTIKTVVLYRATKSLVLYLQMVGRGSRTVKGKETFNILDFGNNISTHGFWHDVRPWALVSKDVKDRPKGEAVLKNCPNCEAFIPVQMVTCSHCGFTDVKKKKEQELAQLQLLDPKELRRRSDGATIERKAEMIKDKLVNPGYVFHNLTSLGEVERLVSLLGYSPYWMEVNHGRYWWSKEYVNKRNSGGVAIKV